MSLWKLLVILALVLGFVLADHGGGKKPKKEKKEKKPKKKYKGKFAQPIFFKTPDGPSLWFERSDQNSRIFL